MKSPLKIHGGKHYLAEWIISLMEPHIHYVEPFFGAGSVLLRKESEGISEVVNDVYQHLTVFWSVISHKESFEKFYRTISVTPFSEPFFDAANHYLDFADLKNPIDTAVSFFIKCRQSRQGLMKEFATLSRNRTRRGINEQVSAWLGAVEGLPEVHNRLKRVVILNRDALNVIESQDGLNTLQYLDPPYLHNTRVTTNNYIHEMDNKQHEKLLSTIKECKGKIMISGYHSDLYDIELKSWNLFEKKIDNKASSKRKKEIKIECIWRNF